MTFKLNSTVRLFLATEMFVFIILAIWITSYSYNCIILVFPLIVWMIIAHSFIEIKMYERVCFKNCYFKSNSLFAKMLSSRIFVVTIYMIMSILMTFTALYAILEYSTGLWIYLFVHIIVSIAVYRLFIVLFGATIKENYRKIFAREWTINIMATLFILVFIYITMNGYEPEYLRHGLKETIVVASQSISSQCDYLNMMLKLQKEIDSIYWWAIHQSSENIENATVKYVMWSVFLLMNALAILGINRFILQVIYLLDKKIIKDEHDTE